MKILIVHNNYGKYSGEEAVVDKMSGMFTDYGHEVCFYRRTSEGSRDSFVGKVKGFVSGIYSSSGVKEMRVILRKEKPDVVNVHNLYPFISPAALFECKRAGIPVVMTVHNFRLICPTGLFMRDGKPCERCLEKRNEWSCILHNCEHSWMKSVGYAARNAMARWTEAYQQCVTRFVCITDFQRQKLITAGYGAGKITVIPNCVDSPKDCAITLGNYVAFLGRLSYEKGYDLLIEVARRHPEIAFRIAGARRDGLYEIVPSNVEMMGYLEGEKLLQFINDCRFVVMPSRWYEGFPMTILESAQLGKPTIGPHHGGFTEIIGQGQEPIGRLFQPGQIDDLENKIVELWNDPDGCKQLGRRAFQKLQQQYSTEVVGKRWIKLLEELVR